MSASESNSRPNWDCFFAMRGSHPQENRIGTQTESAESRPGLARTHRALVLEKSTSAQRTAGEVARSQQVRQKIDADAPVIERQNFRWPRVRFRPGADVIFFWQ